MSPDSLFLSLIVQGALPTSHRSHPHHLCTALHSPQHDPSDRPPLGLRRPASDGRRRRRCPRKRHSSRCCGTGCPRRRDRSQARARRGEYDAPHPGCGREHREQRPRQAREGVCARDAAPHPGRGERPGQGQRRQRRRRWQRRTWGSPSARGCWFRAGRGGCGGGHGRDDELRVFCGVL
ncbi:hypothetical protein Micbo1qcDRAFT_164537 [Microdochium bolleyi]|uniref:Uncharacterized protein n=1 Tax=Microdochium bolleyi TaxID=196109 RepID=A0A136IYQ5_9PEZI|nr:hypothetical protein Micbo1qcDRAFT_164537 [Microdochium bolleyi]